VFLLPHPSADQEVRPSALTYRLNGLDPQVKALLETFQSKFSAASAQPQPFSIGDLAGEDRFDA
jgi:hypothetical protein